jgi:hypothetical protein
MRGPDVRESLPLAPTAQRVPAALGPLHEIVLGRRGSGRVSTSSEPRASVPPKGQEAARWLGARSVLAGP